MKKSRKLHHEILRLLVQTSIRALAGAISCCGADEVRRAADHVVMGDVYHASLELGLQSTKAWVAFDEEFGVTAKLGALDPLGERHSYKKKTHGKKGRVATRA
jgi:hypothetical protein